MMRFRSLTCLICCLALWGAAPVAARANTYKFEIAYDIYAGGMHLIDITQQFQMSDTAYSSTLVAKPTGFFSKIVPWEGRYSTTGIVKSGQLIPSRHEKTSRWGNERDETIMVFNANGQLTRMTDNDWINGKAKPPAKDITPDPALTNNAVDLVTAVLQMLQHAQDSGVQTKQACQSTNTVFDGKRRFAMQFTDLGKSTLDKSKYNAFSGPARRCQIEIKPLAGFKGKKRGFYKIQEDSRAQGQLPSLWLVPAWSTPVGAPPIPARMLIKSEYGAILVHATKVTRQ